MRYSLTLAYNGTSFLGSQTQKESTNTVLGAVEIVLNKLGIHSKIVASGRTDKGVHATGQVCHIDVPPYWKNREKLQSTLNRMLPQSIHVKSIKEVQADFHARYSAKKRVYRYILKEGESNPFEDLFVTFEKNIELETISKKTKLFEGEHDFKHFMKTGSDTKSSVREIYRTFAYKHKGYIVLYFEANGFLRSQIRLMVGALLQLSEKEILEQLSLEKQHKVKPAKSNGLYLAKIKY